MMHPPVSNYRILLTDTRSLFYCYGYGRMAEYHCMLAEENAFPEQRRSA